MKSVFDIRYIKLHFTIEFPSDCIMPQNKASAIRGGMGEMLLRANCIRDRKCEECDFASECIVRRTMYSSYEIEPEDIGVGSGDSIGYVIECENYETEFFAGDRIQFNLILFGKTIVYFNQYMQAFYALGQNGIGKEKTRFDIVEVTNSKGDRILDGCNVYMGQYQIGTLSDYVKHRMRYIHSLENITVEFKTPVTIKRNGSFIQEFDPEAILSAIKRRLYLLDCFEGIDGKEYYKSDTMIPEVLYQEHRFISVNRYSSTKDSKMALRGIKGKFVFDSIDEETLKLLLATEIMHVGKNTSFGFGRVRVALDAN